MPSPDRIEALIAQRGDFVAAIEAFYTDDATMPENSRGVGRDARGERAPRRRVREGSGPCVRRVRAITS